MAGRWIVVLALLILGTNLALGDDGGGIPYRAQIVVPGDPTLERQMQQISQLVAGNDDLRAIGNPTPLLAQRQICFCP